MRASSRWSKFSKAIVELWRVISNADSYLPERHYMRGPGPRWNEKYSATHRGDG